MKTRLPVIAGMAVAAVACGGSTLGSRVSYQIVEVPHPLMSGGVAGSCVDGLGIDQSKADTYRWAVGTELQVTADWPDRTDCTGLIQRTCPAVQSS